MAKQQAPDEPSLSSPEPRDGGRLTRSADREIAGLELLLANTEMKLEAAIAQNRSGDVETLSRHCEKVRERIELAHSIRANCAR